MRAKFTAKYIENLRCETYRRLEVWDITFPAFGIRISGNGHKSWFCSVRRDGKSARITIGNYTTMSLSEARDAARVAIKAQHLGAKIERPPLRVIAAPVSREGTPLHDKLSLQQPQL